MRPEDSWVIERGRRGGGEAEKEGEGEKEGGGRGFDVSPEESFDVKLIDSGWERYHESRRCSRDTFPESCIYDPVY